MGLKLIVVVAFSLVLGPFFWYFTLYLPYNAIATVGSQNIVNLGTNSTLSDAIIVFLDNLVTYALVIYILAVAYFAWVMSQERGAPVYG